MGGMLSFFKSNKMEEPEENFQSWISDSMHVLGDRRLNQIAMPGTHNSATYSFTRASRYAADKPDLVKYRPPWPVSSIIVQWSKTQERTILEQLEDGIRYFDFRVGQQNGEFYSCHGMNGDTIGELVKTFVSYADRYPHEPVILDFNHFYGMTTESHETLVQQLHEIVGNKLWPIEHAGATLNEAQRMNIGPIVIIYHSYIAHKYNFFSASSISAPWHNTDDMELLRERLQESLLHFDRYTSQLFVSQCIITPGTDTALRGWWKWNHPRTLFGLASKVNEEIVKWIANFHKDRPLNIVLVDHYHTTNIVDLVVKLNFTS